MQPGAWWMSNERTALVRDGMAATTARSTMRCLIAECLGQGAHGARVIAHRNSSNLQQPEAR